MDLTSLCQIFFSPPAPRRLLCLSIRALTKVAMRSLTQHAHLPQTDGVGFFRGLMRGGMPLPRSCVRDAVPSLPEPASHHQAERLGRGLLSWSPLALRYQPGRLCDEHQSGRFPPLRGEPEQSSAGEHSA